MTTPLGTPSTASANSNNAQIVLQAVRQRFPGWVEQCRPYVNVLTLHEWNKRGFRVKKGEKAIRVNALIPVWKEDNGAKVQVGHRYGRAYVFALPQVEKRADFRGMNTHTSASGSASAVASLVSAGAATTPSLATSTSGTSGITSGSSTP